MSPDWKERWQQRHGDFAVPCLVSGRWMEFSQEGSTRLPEGEALVVSVMTEGTSEQAKKLCELIVTREDILKVLALIERPGR